MTTEGSGILTGTAVALCKICKNKNDMKKILFVAAACLLAVACKPTENGGTTASLEVSPSSLTFGAEDATPQEIAVTATGVEWNYTVPSTADWITVDDGTAGKLLVSVAKNTTAEQRTASIAIKPLNNDDVKAKSVTVTQTGSENPEVYALTVEPAALTFEAEGAAGQGVKVTASGEGITWSAAADEWITLSTTEGAEGETTLTVTVEDNPETVQRVANVTLTPSVESVGPKAIRVTQEAKVLPPSFSMSYNGEELPEEGFTADYKGNISWHINVFPVNIEWSVKTEYDTGGSGWLTVNTYESDEVNNININCGTRNDAAEERIARVVVTTGEEGIGPFEIKVTQGGKPDFLSTITEDVDFALTHCYALIYPNNDWRDLPSTLWDLRLWSDGVEFTGSAYTGTGDRLCVYFYSEPLALNDDNEYYLPDGTYTVVAYGDGADTLNAGEIRGGGETRNYTYPMGSWYSRIDESAFVGHALISEGTATVTRSGESYTITFDFTSDAMAGVTGTFEGEFDIHIQP